MEVVAGGERGVGGAASGPLDEVAAHSVVRFGVTDAMG